MKFLILLALISCGKHEQPSALDLNDSDGDQVLNYQEGESEKYIADFEALGRVKGRIKFTTDIQGEVSFSNSSDLLKEPLKIMIGDVSQKDLEEYFNEWSKVEVEKSPDYKTNHERNLLHIYFDHVETEPTELILSSGNVKRSLGNWSSYMRVVLSKDEFEGLFNKQAHLSLRKNFQSTSLFNESAENTIRQKTHRVFFSNGSKTQVLYVAKDLTLEKLTHYLEIAKPLPVTNSSLFFNSLDQGGSEWFIRKFKTGDYAIVKSSIQDIKAKFFEKLVSRNQQLKRANGFVVKNIKLTNKKGDQIYLKVRPSQTIRAFKESQKSVTYRVGSPAQGTDDSWVCIHYNREVESRKAAIVSIEEFFKTIRSPVLASEIKYLEQYDEKGMFWEVMLTAPSDNLELSLSPMPESTFTVIGEYLVSCERGRRSSGGSAANVEEHLTFDVETFVEKMN